MTTLELVVSAAVDLLEAAPPIDVDISSEARNRYVAARKALRTALTLADDEELV